MNPTISATRKSQLLYTTINSLTMNYTITKREKEILKLISEELTSKEIAYNLHVSLHTIQSHRKNMLSKFNVRNTAGLVRIAYESGICAVPQSQSL